VWDAGRAGTMLWLQFGARVRAPSANDPDRVTGEYALHLQSPWRISSRNGIVVGASDLYVPLDAEVPEFMFDPGRPGDALADLHLRQWIAAYSSRPLVVVGIDVDRCSGFELRLSEGYAIEVFPNSSEPTHESEEWRLLQPGQDKPHFVVRSGSASLE
jgi:hypothetical protein